MALFHERTLIQYGRLAAAGADVTALRIASAWCAIGWPARRSGRLCAERQVR
jgi:hypothetical protein